MSNRPYSTDDSINTVSNSIHEGFAQETKEQKASYLPSVVPVDIGFFGSPYQAADAMLTPDQIGVRVGNSMSDVVRAVKGVGFYTDQIGFGEASNPLTRGMNLQPLGINYFIKTGMTCSNGAEMWHYMEGIPKGDALGKKMAQVMQRMKLPALRGLAPGMIEDAKNGLDPAPLINSLFGSGYPKCKQVTMPVGDAYNRIRDPDTGENWIGDRTGLTYVGGRPMQTRWVQETDLNGKPINLTRDQWVAADKTFNKDGTPVRPKAKEAFQNMINAPATAIVVGVLCVLAFGMLRK